MWPFQSDEKPKTADASKHVRDDIRTVNDEQLAGSSQHNIPALGQIEIERGKISPDPKPSKYLYVPPATVNGRLNELFRLNEHGFHSFEWNTTMLLLSYAVPAGMLFGGWKRVKEARRPGMTPREIRKLFAEGGVKTAGRYVLATSLYCTSLSVATAIRNKLEPLDFPTSACVALSLTNLIWQREMIAFVHGGFVGLIGGLGFLVLTWPAILLSNKSFDESYKTLRQQHYEHFLREKELDEVQNS